jgi:DNA polymerase-3 subunit alpha
MGKKKKDIVDKMKPKFIEGGKRNGHDPEVLEKIWSDWEKFASYAFNKSHATCYSWVAYQTAYLKANYPAEFMAAIMSRRKDQITEITKLMDECRSLGIETLGPDVNESRLKFTVNKRGEIRFGLGAIKGMGEAPSNAIIAEREKNGPYKDIFDFAERVDMRNVNRKVFESLAYSGAFDGFGLRREQYFGTNAKGEVFLDTLLRYGSLVQQEKAQAANSLFGGTDAVAVMHPAIPAGDRWPTIEKLNKEREMVGIYLSAHPLDEYSIVLNHMCNTTCAEIGREADKAELAKREELTFGGIVTQVVERFSHKTGKPFGFVTIEDFNTSGELALFGDEWTKWNGLLKENYNVYVTAKSVERFRNSNNYELRIQNVEQLFDVKEKRLEKITIHLDMARLDMEMVANLTSLLQDHPGTTELYIQLKTAESQNNILMRSRNMRVSVDKRLIMALDSTENLSYSIN